MSQTLFFDIFGRDKGVGKMLDDVADKADKNSGKVGHSIGGIGKAVGALGGIFAGIQVAEFTGNAVKSFASLEDATAAASVIYQGNMERIIDLSKNGATALGISATQVVASAQMFGVFGKAAGLSGDALETFGLEMTTLSGDMASFTGKSVEEAITAIGAGLRGESEPLRQFGILLDDATLRQRALSMGLIATTKDALTPQQRALAAQAEIMAQAKDMTGDFARTQDSTANVAKTLTAETANLSGKIGSVLAPAFTAVRDGAMGFVGQLSKNH